MPTLFDDPPVVVHGPHDASDEPMYRTQLGMVRSLMKDRQWRTLAEITAAVGCSDASASARLRDIRNQIGVPVSRRKRQGQKVYEYRMETP